MWLDEHLWKTLVSECRRSDTQTKYGGRAFAKRLENMRGVNCKEKCSNISAVCKDKCDRLSSDSLSRYMRSSTKDISANCYPSDKTHHSRMQRSSCRRNPSLAEQHACPYWTPSQHNLQPHPVTQIIFVTAAKIRKLGNNSLDPARTTETAQKGKDMCGTGLHNLFLSETMHSKQARQTPCGY
jgi:hypothetical protein